MRPVPIYQSSANVPISLTLGFSYNSNSFYQTNLNRITQQIIDSPFYNTPADNVTLLPYIRTLNLYGVGNGLYFNITDIVAQSLSFSSNLNLFANYSFVVGACVTVVAVKQNDIAGRQLTGYEKSGRLMMRSTGGGYGLR